MIYILSVLFTVCFVMYSKYQFYDQDAAYPKGKWHGWGMNMRFFMFYTPFIMQYYPASWQDYLLAGVINVVLWELLINKIALNREWLYVGTTAWTDKTLGKWKWILMLLSLGIVLAIRLL